MTETERDNIAGTIARHLINEEHYSTAQAADLSFKLADLIADEHQCGSDGPES